MTESIKQQRFQCYWGVVHLLEWNKPCINVLFSRNYNPRWFPIQALLFAKIRSFWFVGSILQFFNCFSFVVLHTRRTLYSKVGIRNAVAMSYRYLQMKKSLTKYRRLSLTMSLYPKVRAWFGSQTSIFKIGGWRTRREFPKRSRCRIGWRTTRNMQKSSEKRRM